MLVNNINIKVVWKEQDNMSQSKEDVQTKYPEPFQLRKESIQNCAIDRAEVLFRKGTNQE